MHSDLDSVTIDQRDSAKGSNDGHDVAFPLTGYEPYDTELNDSVSSEFIDSQGPLFYVTPSSDQDMDDTALGKVLAEVHREYADYRSPEGVFVSPLSMSLMVDRTGKLVEEIIGIAEECESSSAQIRTLFDEQRRTIIAECCEKVSHHEFQAARAEQERKFYKKNDGVSKRICVKFINKVLLRWRNYENSEFYLRYAHQTEVHRGSEHYYGIIRKTTRIAMK